MIKQYFLAAAVLLAGVPASAAVPFLKGRKPLPAKVSHAALPVRAASGVLLEEDFSKFVGGTEDIPGEEIRYVDGYHVPEELTSMPGWTGGGIFPAAGTIALKDRKDYDQLGYISTPPLDLGGTATLTFRARILPGSSAGSLWIALCDDYYGPGEDQGDFDLSAEWKEYAMTATHGSLYDPSYFQFQAENGYVQIDDVRIEFKRDRLPTPVPLRALNVSPTEFVARWEDVEVPSYRLNVFCKEAPAEMEKGILTETFDGINVDEDGKTIDADDPGWPEGWEFDLSNGTQEVSTEKENVHSEPVSLKFDAVGDVVTSPETPQPVDGLKFWIRPSSMEEAGEELSLVRVELYHSLTGKWENIAQLPYYWMSEDGGFYEFAAEALGDDVTRVRLSMIQRGSIDFYVDDVTLSYSTRGETTRLIEDLDVEGTEYAVKGILPENEYSYYVQAVDGELVSEPSAVVWVDGVEGLRPEVAQASEVTAESFRANWKPLGHATDYRVETSRIVRAAADMRGVVVNEETFDEITEEGNDWVSPYDFADNGMARTGWGATRPAWKPGMAGTQGTSWIGEAGLVFSPYLDLSGNGNEGFDVECTVETTVESITWEDGTTYPEGMFVMALRTPRDTSALLSAYFETSTVGQHTAKLHVANPEGVDLSNVLVAFMNVTGTTFFVDEVRITQDLKAGEELVAPLSVEKTESTSVIVGGLEEESDYGYSVTASVMRNYETYVSEKSDMMRVRTIATSVEDVTETEGITVATSKGRLTVDAADGAGIAVYSASGVKMTEGKGRVSVRVAPGIYVVKSGERTVKVSAR